MTCRPLYFVVCELTCFMSHRYKIVENAKYQVIWWRFWCKICNQRIHNCFFKMMIFLIMGLALCLWMLSSYQFKLTSPCVVTALWLCYGNSISHNWLIADWPFDHAYAHIPWYLWLPCMKPNNELLTLVLL